MPLIKGKGTSTSDSIPMQVQNGAYILPADTTNEIMVSDGEFEIPPEAMSAIGVQFLDMLRHQTSDIVKKARKESDGKHFAVGGRVMRGLAKGYDVLDKFKQPVTLGSGRTAQAANYIKNKAISGTGTVGTGLALLEPAYDIGTDAADVFGSDLPTSHKVAWGVNAGLRGLGTAAVAKASPLLASPFNHGMKYLQNKAGELAGGYDIAGAARQMNESKAQTARNQALIDAHPNNPNNILASEATTVTDNTDAQDQRDWEAYVAGQAQRNTSMGLGVPEEPIEERTPVWSGNRFEASRTGRYGEPVYDLASLQQARERGFDPNSSVNSYNPDVMNEGLQARHDAEMARRIAEIERIEQGRGGVFPVSGVIGTDPSARNQERRIERQRADLMRTITSSNSTRSQRAAASQVLSQLEAGLANRDVAGIQGQSSLGVAGIQGDASRDVAGIQGQSSLGVAGIQGDTSRNVAGITGDANRDVAMINAMARQYDSDNVAETARLGAASGKGHNPKDTLMAQYAMLQQEALQKGDMELAQKYGTSMFALSGGDSNKPRTLRDSYGNEQFVTSSGSLLSRQDLWDRADVITSDKKFSKLSSVEEKRNALTTAMKPIIMQLDPSVRESVFRDLLAGYGLLGRE